MSKNFKIYQDGELQIIERLIYPKFKGVITFNSPLSDIEDIEVDEEVMDAGDIAHALREAGEYILNFKKQADE